MRKEDNCIIAFTRNPELGKVKTRLAKTIGDIAALNVYKFLLIHTEKTIRNIKADKAIYYSVKIRKHDIWEEKNYKKYSQKGEDLGFRMQNAFQKAIQEGYKKMVIVGSDLYDLNEDHINEAFKQLDFNDIVIGPAQDGGYYLLGMKTMHAPIFKNKKWGTASVLKDTLQDLEKSKVFLLEELNDIDTFEDMENNSILKKLIQP